MKVGINTTPLSSLKESVIGLVNIINNTELEIDENRINFNPTIVEDGVILQDIYSKRGVIVGHIEMESLFPSVIDLTPFYKIDTTTFQLEPNALRSECEERVKRYNAIKRNSARLVNELINPEQSRCSERVIKAFTVFRNVTGFDLVDLNEFEVEEGGDIIELRVPKSNIKFAGSIILRIPYNER